MDPFEQLIAENDRYVREGRHRELGVRPSRQIAVVTCMDARIDSFAAYGLQLGECHVIRNAGGRVTDDVLRSLTLSTHALGVRAILVATHTNCGVRDPDGSMTQRLEQLLGHPALPRDWGTFADPADAVRADCEVLRSWPDRPEGLVVGGYVFDVTDGRLDQVVAPFEAPAP
ncbi:MAG: carbonic anhydrase [Nitriliruptoraceae bacterium]|nr:carbonic anhydrase [Nitriliruptoraceae bacterium]